MLLVARCVLLAIIVFLAVAGFPTPVWGQDQDFSNRHDLSGPFGGRLTPTGSIDPDVAIARDEAMRQKTRVFLAPAVARAEGLELLAGSTFGVLVPETIMPTRRKARFQVGYSYVDQESVDHRDKFSLGVRSEVHVKKVEIPGSGGQTRTAYLINVNGSHSDGRHLKQRTDVSLYGEWFLPSVPVSLSLTVGGAKAVSSTFDESDLILNPGISIAFSGTVALSLDYTVKNAVDGDADDYSAALGWDVTPDASLTFIAGKDSFVQVGGFFRF